MNNKHMRTQTQTHKDTKAARRHTRTDMDTGMTQEHVFEYCQYSGTKHTYARIFGYCLSQGYIQKYTDMIIEPLYGTTVEITAHKTGDL